MDDYMVVNQNAVIEHDGERVILRAGVQIAHKDHPIVKDHPRLWDPAKVHFDMPGSRSKTVETTTAAPGEKRSVTASSGTSAAPTRRGRRTGTTKEGDDK